MVPSEILFCLRRIIRREDMNSAWKRLLLQITAVWARCILSQMPVKNMLLSRSLVWKLMSSTIIVWKMPIIRRARPVISFFSLRMTRGWRTYWISIIRLRQMVSIMKQERTGIIFRNGAKGLSRHRHVSAAKSRAPFSKVIWNKLKILSAFTEKFSTNSISRFSLAILRSNYRLIARS